MNRIAELDHHISYCERLKRELEPLRTELPEDLRPRLDAVLTKADAALEAARGPVKIGVVGEFSAGKSLVLGAIMGSADALPVNEVPTTGNITEIRFGQLDAADGDRACRIASCRIRFLTRDQVFDCRGYMVEQTVAALGRIGVRTDLVARLGAAGADDGSQGWRELQACCAMIWTETNNPEVRFLIKDLMQLARVYPGAGAALCGRDYEVPINVARAALSLPDGPSNLQHAAFSDMVPPAIELSAAPSELDATTVAAAFHLIRCCELQVLVAKKVWDLSSLKGQNELMLLDFPGLGASGSSVRDAYLCRREMARVQTILLLINGHRPGSGDAATLFSMMQADRQDSLRDAVLVGVGRFDQVPIQGDEAERLRRLLSPEPEGQELETVVDDGFFQTDDSKSLFDLDDAGPLPAERERLTEQDVREGVRALSRALSDAASLSADPDRTLLLSPVIYFGELLRRLPGAAAIDSRLLADLERSFAAAEPVRGLWRDVAAKLSSDGSAGRLAELLTELVKDGGIDRLRRTLGAHVADHGVRQLVDTVIRRTDEAADAIKQLGRVLPSSEQAPVAVASEAGATVAAQLRDLKRAYIALKIRLHNSPPDLMIETPGGRRRLVDHVREEVETRVFAWPEWRNLFLLIRAEDSLVDLRKGMKSPLLFGLDDAVDDEDKSAVPLRSADLKPGFRATYDELRQQIEQLARDAIADWLDEIGTQLAAERQPLSGLINDQSRQRIADSGNTRGQQRLGHLLMAMEPRRLKDALVKQALQAAGGTPDLGLGDGHPADRFFPLRDDRRFGWDPSLAELNPPVEMPPVTRHHAQVLRIRTELVASLSRELKETVSRINKAAALSFMQVVDEIPTRVIEDCLADDALLNGLAGDGPAATDDGAPDARRLCQSLYESKPGS